MAEEVKVPGVGTQNKKVVQVVVGGAAVFVAWRWFAAKRSSAAAATAAAGPAPLPVDTSNIGASQSGVGYQNPGSGLGGGTGGAGAAGLSTNAAWTQKVEGDLSNLGYDAQAVSLALGLYLSGQPLSLDQQNIVRTAWAYEGKPPETTNLAIIPAQVNPTPPPAPTPEPAPAPTPAPPPAPAPSPAPDPHTGQHLQPPQVATLSHGVSMTHYAQGVYGAGYAPHLAILVSLNPTVNPNDTSHPTMLIRTSDARWVNN